MVVRRAWGGGSGKKMSKREARKRLIRVARIYIDACAIGGGGIGVFFRREKKGLVVGGCWRGGWNGECARVLAATSQKTLPRLASLQYLWGCSCERAIPVRASSPRCPLKVRTSPG